MNSVSPFTKRLKQARTHAGLSQRELGIRAGIDALSASARMNQYEKGVHSPDYEIAQSIAQELNVPTCYLFCEEDDVADMLVAYHRGDAEQRQAALDSLHVRRAAEDSAQYNAD
ncbi:helix-turn-helix transcriptional regulator [Pseudomaricurvus alkylphenolicus]|uniref:helix-turn-helix domain-containing protein n=1 Tax=Pseudomaricurvus alkylphenolicus TaxID=1306991 RepID=UPI00141F572C|nr:helix-turn-helix transcriptional regulator [Pseudomaricurvus alkylphenolicus]NIB44317.1 helix-turn-helix transcriptional regulator [Pseudomaricurvus alkylphenolicus]